MYCTLERFLTRFSLATTISSSPDGLTFAVKGLPGTSSSANLMLIVYLPGSTGRYSTEHVPSSLSVHVIWAFDGPSIDKPSPP